MNARDLAELRDRVARARLAQPATPARALTAREKAGQSALAALREAERRHGRRPLAT